MTAPAESAVDLTVIMPVRNEGPFISGALDAILEQTVFADGRLTAEILVVDGMSTDDTRAQVERRAADALPIGVEVRLLDNPGRIAPCAMNAGLRPARGRFIARVDGHCHLRPDYLERALALLEDTDADGVGGVLETVGDGLVARAIAAAMSSRFGVGGSAFRVLDEGAPPRATDTVAFPVYRRDAIARTGAYDEELVRDQDDEWNYRLRAQGGRLLTSGDLVATYFSRASLCKMARQYFQYGLFKVRVLQLHPRQMSWRQFVPPAFVGALAGGACLVPWTLLPLAMVLGSYVLANAAATLWTASRTGWSLLPLLPIAFTLLHLGYGAGFLVGLVRFARRWGDGNGRVPDLGWAP